MVQGGQGDLSRPHFPPRAISNSSRFHEKMLGIWRGTLSMILNWVWQPNRIVILGCGTQSQLQSALAGAPDKHSFCGKCLVRGFTILIHSLLQIDLIELTKLLRNMTGIHMKRLSLITFKLYNTIFNRILMYQKLTFLFIQISAQSGFFTVLPIDPEYPEHTA